MQIPTKKSVVRFQDMAACGRNKESEKSIAIPIHQRTAMRLREPLSRAFEESVDRLTLQATTSGSIQDAQAPQKIRAKIGLAENGKGRICIFFEQPTAYGRKPSSWLSISSGGSKLVSVVRFVVFILAMIWPRTAAILPQWCRPDTLTGWRFAPEYKILVN